MRIPVRLLLLGLLAVLATACGRGDIFAPTPTSVLFVPSPTPRATADPTAAAAAAAERGEVIFNQFYQEAGFQCSTCHNANQDIAGTGPAMVGLSERAGNRIAGQDAVAYIRNSIVNPNSYVVEGYNAGLMPQVYADILSEQELNDLVAYLMTL